MVAWSERARPAADWPEPWPLDWLLADVPEVRPTPDELAAEEPLCRAPVEVEPLFEPPDAVERVFPDDPPEAVLPGVAPDRAAAARAWLSVVAASDTVR